MGSPRFNRINPNRSIPTTRSRSGKAYWNHSFQSYQSKQINPDDDIVTTPTFVPGKGFNLDYMSASDEQEFQSYQSKQIYPDHGATINLSKRKKFQSYQFRQINPDMMPTVSWGQQ